MKFEHVGINVPDAKAMAEWYVEYCGMSVVKSSGPPVHCHFLADATGRTVVEIYTNEKAPVPDYASQPPLVYHFAMAVENPGALKTLLLEKGATLVVEETLDDGSYLVTLRDPWGIPLQLCKRATAMP